MEFDTRDRMIVKVRNKSYKDCRIAPDLFMYIQPTRKDGDSVELAHRTLNHIAVKYCLPERLHYELRHHHDDQFVLTIRECINKVRVDIFMYLHAKANIWKVEGDILRGLTPEQIKNIGADMAYEVGG